MLDIYFAATVGDAIVVSVDGVVEDGVTIGDKFVVSLPHGLVDVYLEATAFRCDCRGQFGEAAGVMADYAIDAVKEWFAKRACPANREGLRLATEALEKARAERAKK